MMARSGSQPGLPVQTWAFSALFVLSGACGLTYEVVWSRYLVDVFGVTAFAVSTVLVSFMGGLALGAALLGRRADRVARPLRMFAILEAGIGLYALFLPLLLRGIDVVHGLAFTGLQDHFFVRSLLRFLLCLAILLVPTILMGGTLPALGQGLVRRKDRVGLGVGILYFVNTLGAAAGCYLSGFVLIPAFGLSRTTLGAAAFNFLIAAIAWVLDRGTAERETTDPAPQDETAGTGEQAGTSPDSWPLVVAFGSGLLALMFEVVWFRVLVLVFGSTVYSFSAMLAVFLLGLAVGSFAMGPIADRVRAPVRLLVITQTLVALFALLGSFVVNRMPVYFLHLVETFGRDFTGMNRTKLLISFLTLLPAAIAFGATFPVAVRLAKSRPGGSTGSRIARVYAWNTVGAILGSFGAGFVLLPTIGSEWTLELVIFGALALALGSVLAEPGRLSARWAGACGLVLVALFGTAVFAPRWDRTLLGAGLYFVPEQFIDWDRIELSVQRIVSDFELKTYTEGYNDTIISFESSQGRFITVNGSTTASNHFEDMFSQRMLGHLPMALHPGRAGKACIVGLGAGVTAGAIGVYEVDRLVAVELEKGVFEASRFFERENHGVLDNPAVEIRIDDGKSYLRLTDERFDVISSAPNFPSLTGSGALYSVEFFELCRKRLAPGGVMCQFAPIWRLDPVEVRTIVGSFTDVFPHVRLFSTGLSLVLLGREESFPPVDVAELTRRVEAPAVSASLREIGVRGPVELLSFYQMDEGEIREWVSDSPRNTNDRPRIEFEAPRSVFAGTVGPNLREIGERRPSLDVLADRLGLEGEYRESFRRLAEAYRATTRAEVAYADGRMADAAELAIPAAESGQRYARYLVADRSEAAGEFLKTEGLLAAAREQFEIAVRYEPSRLPALIGLGNTSLHLGDLDRAEEVLTAAVERYPRSALALYQLGLLRQARGQLAEAEQLYRRAIGMQEVLGRPHALLGSILLADGRVQEGWAHLERAYDLGERSEGVLLARVRALVALGRRDDALRGAREAVDALPQSRAASDLLRRLQAAPADPGEREGG